MRLSIFSTIFIIFMVVVSPLYIISVIINIEGQNRTQRDIYLNTLSNMDFYVSNIEDTIRTIVATEVTLINNTDIHDMSRLRDIPYTFDAFRKMENITKKLQEIKSASPYIEQAYILFPASGLKITERSRQIMTDFDYSCAADGDFINGFPFNNHASGVYINFTSEYHRKTPDYERLTYIIAAKIDTERIAREMRDYFAGAEDQMCFVGEVNGLTVQNNMDDASLPEIAAFVASAKSEKSIELLYLKAQEKKLLMAYRTSPYLKGTFVLAREEQALLGALQSYRYWNWILTGVTLILLVVFTVWTRAILAVPMNRLIEAIKRGIAGDRDNMIEYRSNEEFMYIYRQFNEMLKIQREAINQIYEQDLLLKSTELKMLQYQINPHFLYNCYFLMYQMMEAAEYATVKRMMAHIGSYFRFVTKSEGFVPLSDELRFCADYIGIQMIRFSSRIKAEISDAPDAFAGLLVPRIILQPILENCYKHGLVNKERGGLIALRFDLDRGAIIVEDNGEDLTDEELARLREMLAQEDSPAMSGLWNVNRRLQSHFGKAYGLSVLRSEWGGLRVEVHVKLR